MLDSPYQDSLVGVDVLLPDALDPAKTYPVVYVLPVEENGGAEYGSGMDEARRADVANAYDVICVAPEFSASPWLGDHATDPACQQERHLLEVVIPEIDRLYPTRCEAAGRWLLGFSKGGWAAFTLLLRHPDIFGYAGAWDVPFLLDGGGDDWGPMGISEVFGTREQFQKFLPTRLAVEKGGTLGRERLLLSPGQYWQSQTEAMHALLEREAIPHEYRRDLLLPHRWDGGWFHPMMNDLAQMARRNQEAPAFTGSKAGSREPSPHYS